MTAQSSSAARAPGNLVESALRQHRDVAESLAIERLTPGLGMRTTVYLEPVPGRSVDLVATHRSLAATIPTEFLPVAYRTLPRNTLGHLDPRTFADPEFWLDAYAPPATETERRLVDIWREALGTDQVGREDDFFDLGGHSILIPLVVASILDVFGVEISVMDGFEHATLFDLAAFIEARRAGAGD